MDAKKPESTRQLFAALCFNCSFPQFDCSYALATDELKLHTLQKRRHHLNAPFLIHVLDTVGFRVPSRYIRDFSMFNVCSSSKKCPSARCASAANFVCRDIDVFVTIALSLKHIL
jgi:hypothetical protein